MNFVKFVVSCAMFFGLAACSGGSGSANSEPPVSVTFNPATLKATLLLGSNQTLSVTATANRTISGTINIGVLDRIGVIDPTITILAASDVSYQAILKASPSLSAGIHIGTLEVRLCRDSPTVCASPIPGSPWQLPYELTVLTPMATVTTVPSAGLNLDIFQDEIRPYEVSAAIGNTVTIFGTGSAATVYPEFVDPANVFRVGATQSSGDSYPHNVTAQVTPNSSLAPGTYSGNVELRLCKTQACTEQYEGSPTLVPYSLNLRSSSNLSTLSRWSNVSEWSQTQGSATHTGYVPVTLDAATFNRRWKWSIPTAALGISSISPVVTDGGRLYIFIYESIASGTLYSIAESDKSNLWQRYFGPFAGPDQYGTPGPFPLADVEFPVTSAGIVHLMASYSGGGDLNLLSGMNGISGSLLYQKNTPGGSFSISGGAGYANSWSFPESTGVATKLQSQDGFNQSDFCSPEPAVDATYFYVPVKYGPAALRAYSLTSGSLAFNIPTAMGGSCTSVMLSTNHNALINFGSVIPGVAGSNKLANFDLTGKTISWSVPTSFANNYAPAIANGVIYLISSGRLEARSESSGELLWTWVPDASDRTPFQPFTIGPQSNLIVTNNILFVSSIHTVYALSLSSHTPVWNYSMRTTNYSSPARLSLSPNGILYIAETDQSVLHTAISAFNVK